MQRRPVRHGPVQHRVRRRDGRAQPPAVRRLQGDGPADPEEWPYRTVVEAIRDGWRVIQFPNLALLLDEKRSYGLGCEFILERRS